MKRPCALLQHPRGAPWIACAFARYLWSGLPAGWGPAPSVLLLVSPAGLGSDSAAPSDSSRWPRAVARRVPRPPSPRLFPSTEPSPGCRMADSHRTRAVACSAPCPSRSARLPRRWTAGSTGCSLSPGHDQRVTWVLPLTARLCFQARRADSADQVCQGPPVPQGFPTLAVLHPIVLQPSTTSRELVSPSWRLAGACCSRRRVVSNAAPQGRIGCLYTPGVSTCFHAACTAHRAQAGRRRLQCVVRRGLGQQARGSCVIRVRP